MNSKEDEERQANLWRLMKEQKKPTKSILDNKYMIIKTIGDGRYAKVKLAVDMSKGKQVAIKFLKVHSGTSKRKALECLHREIKILSECDHPNIAKIIASSFDGVLITEPYSNDQDQKNSCLSNAKENCSGKSIGDDDILDVNSSKIKRKKNVCYYVMKFAEYGELFKFIEHTDRFTEKLSKSFFYQLVQGLQYLHDNGVAHRDLKPENLLIDSKFRLIIADLGFAIQLEKDQMKGSLYTQYVQKCRLVGSEDYNAPEILQEELMATDQMQKGQEINQKSDLDNAIIQQNSSNSKGNQKFILYDPMKADLFSLATTLFIIVMRCSPFRKAHAKDPYFKRLCAVDRRPFWNIFKTIPCSPEFKDLFEQLTKRDPEERINLKHVLNHQWLMNSEQSFIELNELEEEIKRRYEVVEKTAVMDFDQLSKNDKIMSQSVDQELMLKDLEDFEQLRVSMIEDIEVVNKRLSYKKNLKIIKKAAMKFMIEDSATPIPSFQTTIQQSNLDTKKEDDYKTPNPVEESICQKQEEDKEDHYYDFLRSERMSSLTDSRFDSFDE
eukprot:403373639